MKDTFVYPLKKMRSNWLGLAAMLAAGAYMALQGNPGFLIGIGAGVVVAYMTFLIYKLIK